MCEFVCAPVSSQSRAEQLWALRDVVVVGAAYRLAAGGGRRGSLRVHLLQALILEKMHKHVRGEERLQRVLREAKLFWILTLEEDKYVKFT